MFYYILEYQFSVKNNNSTACVIHGILTYIHSYFQAIKIITDALATLEPADASKQKYH